MAEVAYITWATDPAAAFAAGPGAAAVVVEEGEEAVGPVKELAVGTGGGLFQAIAVFVILVSCST